MREVPLSVTIDTHYGIKNILPNGRHVIVQASGISIITSDDGGETWIERYNDGNIYSHPRILFIDSRGYLFTNRGQSGNRGYVLRSTDNGTNWSIVLDSKVASPEQYSNHFWYMAESSDGTLYTNEYSFGTPGVTEGAVGKKVYKSTDGGANWSIWYTSPYDIRHLHGIFIDSKDNFFLSAAHPQNGETAVPATWRISEDAVLGDVIEPKGIGNGMTAFVEADNGNLIFGSDWQNGIYKLVGNTFVEVVGDADFFPAMFGNVLAMCKGHDGVIYASVNENGNLLASADDGETWYWLNTGTDLALGGTLTASLDGSKLIFMDRGFAHTLLWFDDMSRQELRDKFTSTATFSGTITTI